MIVSNKSGRSGKLIILFALFITAATAVVVLTRQGKDENTLYQVSVLSGLVRGDYDGKVSLTEIRRHGDFGIGTFDRLDGEAIELDGVFYQISADGSVHRPSLNLKSPFVMNAFFHADSKFPAGQLPDYHSLQALIDRHLKTKNRPYAVRLDGKFRYVKVRSVPPQSKPYRALSEITKDQGVFEFRDVEGTLIGFRIPDYMGGANLPGYHMHFLSSDKTRGGHLLDCSVNSGEIRIDVLDRFLMALPESQEFDGLNLSVDPEEVSKVEAGK